ncbi:MAG: Insertion element protein [bacterium]|uniref:Insertion element protein n=1 Tax=Candidatus Methylomirabilis tolerans TaxID=3123416 RepID=A0AAJ1EIX7_9BACT|nr:Insertion element protein [Candidatus Methylomirabilis sp.]
MRIACPEEGRVEIRGGEVMCPSCGSEAVNRYGRAWTHKQRFRCLMCGRQFTLGNRKTTPAKRPLCGKCGKPMHIYRREGNVIRFRCSGYPSCRGFQKIMSEEV